MTHRLLLLAALLSCGFLSSCSVAFNREWKAAVKADPKAGVEGAWAGTWKSEANGHHGKLRCIVGPAKNSRGDRDFHYHATWMGILSGAYRSTHQVTPTPSGATFQGQHQMPAWAGGLYTYKGTIKGGDFHATYECAKDHGAYALKRVQR